MLNFLKTFNIKSSSILKSVDSIRTIIDSAERFSRTYVL